MSTWDRGGLWAPVTWPGEARTAGSGETIEEAVIVWVVAELQTKGRSVEMDQSGNVSEKAMTGIG